MKNNPSEFNFYKSSGFSDFKKYMLHFLLNSNQYNQKSLKLEVAKFFEFLSKKFILIKTSLKYNERENDKEYFNNEENERNILNIIYIIIDKESKIIKNKFINSKINIKKCILELKNHLKDTRGDFTKKENAILEEVQEICQNNNNEINYILNYISKTYKNLISDILEHTKLNHENEIDQLNIYNSINIEGHEEDNFATKFYDETPIKVMLCIPFVNYIPLAIMGIGGIIDHFINHSDEYLREINRIIDISNEEMDNNLDEIIRKVNSIESNFSNKIKDIFQINRAVSEKNWKNYSQIIKAIENYEKFLEENLTKIK